MMLVASAGVVRVYIPVSYTFLLATTSVLPFFRTISLPPIKSADELYYDPTTKITVYNVCGYERAISALTVLVLDYG